jgi:hypothetical protein
MGKTVIVSRLKAIRHYFSEDALAYFEPDNRADLSRQMVCSYRNPPMRARLALKAKDEYASIRWDLMKQRYLTLIDDLIGTARRHADARTKDVA